MKTKLLGIIISIFFLIFMACGQQKEKTETTTEKTGQSTEETMNKSLPEKPAEQSKVPRVQKKVSLEKPGRRRLTIQMEIQTKLGNS